MSLNKERQVINEQEDEIGTSNAMIVLNEGEQNTSSAMMQLN